MQIVNWQIFFIAPTTQTCYKITEGGEKKKNINLFVKNTDRLKVLQINTSPIGLQTHTNTVCVWPLIDSGLVVIVVLSRTGWPNNSTMWHSLQVYTWLWYNPVNHVFILISISLHQWQKEKPSASTDRAPLSQLNNNIQRTLAPLHLNSKTTIMTK